ncbi:MULTISPECIES: hypothetical protein [Microcoleaceae]|uniref:hypothetical protein n=1 Tax=Microcoleaceae TaxID=1892252 RepID=UPI0018811D19|nr:hypothetical protein [Tychonema sp. LEGE 06208]MBE9163289.1 hypothetical protein [Tychonema sp. LEGE 06208]
MSNDVRDSASLAEHLCGLGNLNFHLRLQVLSDFLLAVSTALSRPDAVETAMYACGFNRPVYV